MENESLKDKIFAKIAKVYDLDNHDFKSKPFVISHQQVKDLCNKYFAHAENSAREIRILGHQIKRESRPKYFIV